MRSSSGELARRVARGFAVLVVALGTALTVLASPGHAAQSTIVSLTFDDGHWSHYQNAHPILLAHGMRGTFYLNTGKMVEVCPAGTFCWPMTFPQAREMYAAGEEMAGHTLTHPDLTTLSTAEVQRQVCDDRNNLIAQGFTPAISFAYPYSAFNATTEGIVRDCGYLSARQVGGFPTGVYAEGIPPADAYAVRTPNNDHTLATLQQIVIDAENHGGGWVPITFHEICDCPDAPSRTTPAILTAFLDWLQQRAAIGTVVRTVGQVITGSTPTVNYPTTTVSCNTAACSAGWYRSTPVTVAMSASDPQGDATSTYYTVDGTDPLTSSSRQAYTAPFALGATTSVRFYSTDAGGNAEPTRTQLVQVDASGPTVSVTNPADGTTIKRGDRVTVSAGAGDAGTGGGAASGLSSVAFYRDGVLVVTDTTAPYQYVWSTRKFALGQHTLTAVATDVAGNQTTSSTVTVTLVR